MSVQLPKNVECDHCVLQWRYHTGNSWGTDEDGHGCLGCGQQEEFYGCADIEIIRDNSISSTISTTTSTSSTTKPTTKTTTKTTTQTTTKNSTTTKTTPKTSTPSVDGEHFCENKSDGLYRHADCNKYYNCFSGQTFVMDCPPGLFFNEKGHYCDWPSNVPECTFSAKLQ